MSSGEYFDGVSVTPNRHKEELLAKSSSNFLLPKTAWRAGFSSTDEKFD
jgi:hypothetical protein